MIYEFRTYDLKPRGVPEFERAFGEKLPERVKFSPLDDRVGRTDRQPARVVVHQHQPAAGACKASEPAGDGHGIGQPCGIRASRHTGVGNDQKSQRRF